MGRRLGHLAKLNDFEHTDHAKISFFGELSELPPPENSGAPITPPDFPDIMERRYRSLGLPKGHHHSVLVHLEGTKITPGALRSIPRPLCPSGRCGGPTVSRQAEVPVRHERPLALPAPIFHLRKPQIHDAGASPQAIFVSGGLETDIKSRVSNCVRTKMLPHGSENDVYCSVDRKEYREVLVIIRTLPNRPRHRFCIRPMDEWFTIPAGQLNEEQPDLHIWGESISSSLGRPGRDRTLPTRILRDFTIFDANNRNKVTALQEFNQARPLDDRVSLRASGLPYIHTTELDGEDDLGDPEEVEAPPITLTEILASKVEYGSTQGMEVWILTRLAWYRLEQPAKGYIDFYNEFWKRHQLVHAAIYAVIVQKKTNETARNLLTEVADPDDPVLKARSWKKSEVRRHEGTLGPELSRFARLHFDTVQAQNDFLQTPIILNLTGGDMHVDLDDFDTDMEERQLTNSQRPLSTRAPPIQMMAFTGGLAKDLFNAKFKVRGKVKHTERAEVRKKQKQDTRAWLQEIQLNTEEWVTCKGEHDVQTGRAKVVHLTNVGKFAVGDYVLISPLTDSFDKMPPEYDPAFKSPNNVVNSFCIMQITRIWHKERPDSWWFHGRRLIPACQTILQELGHSQELVMTPVCQNLRIACLRRTLDVKLIGPHEDFIEPEDARVDSLFFFLRYQCDFDGSFKHLPERVRDFDDPDQWNCSCKNLVEETTRQTTPAISEVEEASDDFPQRVLAFRDGFYWLHDYVYLIPPIREPLGPYRIGQIISIDAKGREVTVNLLGRHEDLARQGNDEAGQGTHVLHTDRLYVAHKKMTVKPTELMGICRVRHASKVVDDNMRRIWASMDGFTVGEQLDPDLPPSEPSLASLRPLPLSGYLPSSRNQIRAEENEIAKIKRFSTLTNPITYFDLYHGAGGWSLGFDQMGFQVVGAVDINPAASDTFKLRHPDVKSRIHCMDARDLLPKMIHDNRKRFPEPGTVDLLLTSPPCQDYSQLNRFKSKDDGRKALVACALTIAEYLKPKYVMMENVPALLHTKLKPRTGPEDEVIKYAVHKYILRSFMGLGYNVRWGLYNTSHFGAPQIRERVFYVAAKRGLDLPAQLRPTHAHAPMTSKGPDLPHPKFLSDWSYTHPKYVSAPHYPLTVYDAIADLPPFDWELTDRICPETPESKRKWEKRREEGIPEISSDVASNEESMTDAGFPRAYKCPPLNSYQEDLRREHQGPPRQHITTYSAPINVERVHGIGLGPSADHRALPPALSMDSLSSMYSKSARRTNYFPGLYGRVQMDSHFPTVVTKIKPSNKQGRCLHPTDMRVLSVRECARAQGFPDDMLFDPENGDPVEMHRLIGNAVPVPLSRAFAKELRRTIIKSWRDPYPDDETFIDPDEGEGVWEDLSD